MHMSIRSVFVLGALLVFWGGAPAYGAQGTVSGWGWSDNAGWFSSQDVRVDSLNRVAGYLWSPTTGWVCLGASCDESLQLAYDPTAGTFSGEGRIMNLGDTAGRLIVYPYAGISWGWNDLWGFMDLSRLRYVCEGDGCGDTSGGGGGAQCVDGGACAIGSCTGVKKCVGSAQVCDVSSDASYPRCGDTCVNLTNPAQSSYDVCTRTSTSACPFPEVCTRPQIEIPPPITAPIIVPPPVVIPPVTPPDAQPIEALPPAAFPWLETRYGDVIARNGVSVRAPEGRYNATYCIISSGNIRAFAKRSDCVLNNYAIVSDPLDAQLYNRIARDRYSFAPSTFPSGDVELGGSVYEVTDTAQFVIGNPVRFLNSATGNASGTLIVRGGDVFIQSDITYAPITSSTTSLSGVASFALIATKDAQGRGGNIFIAPTVRELVGAYIAQGTINTAYGPAGSVVPLKVSGLMTAYQFALNRTFASKESGAEVIAYDGRLLVNPPPGLEHAGSLISVVRSSQ